MTVTVYVWKPHRPEVGHAALQCNPSSQLLDARRRYREQSGKIVVVGNCYISFWPAENVNLANPFAVTKSTLHNSLAEDEKSDNEGIPPHHSVTINKLDEAAILDFYCQLLLTYPHYAAYGFNCSHPVKIALWEGSKISPNFRVRVDDKVYPTPKQYAKLAPAVQEFLRSQWSPWDVYRYAMYLKHRLG